MINKTVKYVLISVTITSLLIIPVFIFFDTQNQYTSVEGKDYMYFIGIPLVSFFLLIVIIIAFFKPLFGGILILALVPLWIFLTTPLYTGLLEAIRIPNVWVPSILLFLGGLSSLTRRFLQRRKISRI